MLTQIDVSRLPSYQWGREDTLKELDALMAEKDSVIQKATVQLQEKETVIQKATVQLQEKETVIQHKELLLKEKEQQTLKLIKKMHKSGMSTSVIADLLEMPVAEIEAQLQSVDVSKH